MRQEKNHPITDKRSFLWLGLGALCFFFTGGRFDVWIAPWLFNVFFLRFVRTRKAAAGYLWLVLVSWIVLCFNWYGIQPLPLDQHVLTMLISSLLGTLPYWGDRLLCKRVPAFASTLVFPLFATSLEYLFIAGNPMGSFGSLAYTQYGNKPFIQLLSITGLMGLTFLINWFASVINDLWERENPSWKSSRPLLVYLVLLAAVHAFGAFRLWTVREQETVAVSSVIRPDQGDVSLSEILSLQREDAWKEEEELLGSYMALTEEEARAGARIISWPEGAYVTDEAAFSEREELFQRTTARLDFYLFVPAILFHEDGSVSNQVSLYTPEGTKGFTHIKYGGNAFEGSLKGDGSVKTAETEFGTISALICWDMDFPAIVAQAGKRGVDILFAPSNEWEAVVPTHARMAVFRGIENGTSIVRPASSGLSIASDPYGREISRLNWFEDKGGVMRAEIPLQGVRTIHSFAAPGFNAFLLLASGGILLYALAGFAARRKRQKREEEGGIMEIDESPY